MEVGVFPRTAFSLEVLFWALERLSVWRSHTAQSSEEVRDCRWWCIGVRLYGALGWLKERVVSRDVKFVMGEPDNLLLCQQ